RLACSPSFPAEASSPEEESSRPFQEASCQDPPSQEASCQGRPSQEAFPSQDPPCLVQPSRVQPYQAPPSQVCPCQEEVPSVLLPCPVPSQGTVPFAGPWRDRDLVRRWAACSALPDRYCPCEPRAGCCRETAPQRSDQHQAPTARTRFHSVHQVPDPGN